MRNALTTKGLCDLIFHIKSAPGGSAVHTVVELGSFGGESTFVFCEHFPEVHAVDTWDYSKGNWSKEVIDGNVNHIEEQFDRCLAFWKGTLVKHKGLTTEVAKTWTRKVELVYIDADHSYEAVRADLAAWVTFVRQGGWIAGHDYDNPEFPGVKRAVDEQFNHVLLFRDWSWAVRLA